MGNLFPPLFVDWQLWRFISKQIKTVGNVAALFFSVLNLLVWRNSGIHFSMYGSKGFCLKDENFLS